MVTLLPVANIAPPAIKAPDIVKLDFVSVKWLPLIEIAPPFEWESPKLIPLLLKHVILEM